MGTGCVIAWTTVFALLFFYFMKSSKKLPRNLRQLKTELKYQFYGSLAIGEDTFGAFRNRVEIVPKPGYVAVLTGGNRGIGLRLLGKLLESKITVIVGVRDTVSSQKTIEEFLQKSNINGNVIYEQLDTSSLNSVRNFAKNVQGKYDKINLLLNNAGVMCVPFKLTSDNFETHMAINYLGHFLLTHLLLPQVIAGGTEANPSRIVNVSSCVHTIGLIDYTDFNSTKDYYEAEAYIRSKLAQVLFTVQLNMMMEQQGAHVKSFSVHPGVVNTDLFENSSTTYIPWVRSIFFKTPEQGSRSIYYAAVSENLEDKGGSYISNCNISKMHHLSKNPEECKKLFDYTCDLLNINSFGKN